MPLVFKIQDPLYTIMSVSRGAKMIQTPSEAQNMKQNEKCHYARKRWNNKQTVCLLASLPLLATLFSLATFRPEWFPGNDPRSEEHIRTRCSKCWNHVSSLFFINNASMIKTPQLLLSTRLRTDILNLRPRYRTKLAWSLWFWPLQRYDTTKGKGQILHLRTRYRRLMHKNLPSGKRST